MNERWIKWDLQDVPYGNYELTSLEQNKEGIRITLDDEINKIIINFDTILALRSCDENERWRTVSEVLAIEDDFFVEWPLYKGVQTEFKKWFQLETFQSWEENEYEHYILATANDIVDILSQVAPRIIVKKINNL